MILIAHKDGKFWPRHETGEWFSDAEREEWASEIAEQNERIYVKVFNDMVLAGAGGFK